MGDTTTVEREQGTGTGPTEQHWQFAEKTLKIDVSKFRLGSTRTPRPTPPKMTASQLFAQQRNQAATRIQKKLPAVGAAIDTVFSERLSKFSDEIASKQGTEAGEQALSRGQQALKDLELEFEQDIAKNGGKNLLEQTGKAQQRSQEQTKSNEKAANELREFNTVAQRVERAAKALMDFDPAGSKNFVHQVEVIRGTVKSNDKPLAGKVLLEELETRIAKAEQLAKSGTGVLVSGTVSGGLDSLSGKPTEQPVPLKEQESKLREDLVKLAKEVATAAKADGAAPLKAGFDALADEVKRLETLAGTANPGAFKAAQGVADEIRAALTGGALALLQQRVGEIGAATKKDAPAAKEFPAECKEIADGLDTVLKDIDLLDLSAAAKSLRELAGQAGALALKSAELVKWRNGVPSRLQALTKLKTETDQLLKGVGGGKYNGRPSTADEIKATIEDVYKNPGVDYQALEKQLAAAENEAQQIALGLKNGTGKDLEKAVKRLEGDMKAGTKMSDERLSEKVKSEQAEQDKSRKLETLTKVTGSIEDQLKQVRQTIEQRLKDGQTGDKATLEELERLLKQVPEKLKSKDAEAAEKQVKSIVASLRELKENPGGVSMQAAGDLAKIDDYWSSAFGSTRKAIGKIVGLAAEPAKGAGVSEQQVTAAAEAIVTRLEKFDALKKSVKIVAADEKGGPDLKQRKAARESALADIRAMRALLQSDGVAGMLRDNPFGVANPFADVEKFLANVEYNALRAVPAE